MYLHIVNYGQFMNSQLAGAETISNDRCVIKLFFFKLLVKRMQVFSGSIVSCLPSFSH